MKRTLITICSALISLCALAQSNYNLNPSAVNNPDGTVTYSNMAVYDRLGNRIDMSNLVINTTKPNCTAGIFKLTFDDFGTGFGFDDAGVGPARQAVACKVFSDLSDLIIAQSSPYTAIPNLGTTNFVEIRVKASNNLPSDPTAGTAGQYFLTNSPGIVHGSVWQTINSGISAWFGVNNNNLVNPGLYHGEMQINFGKIFYLSLTNSGTTNSTPIAAGQTNLYAVILHEGIHALGFGSLINSDGTSKISGSGIYSFYDTFLADAANSSNKLISTNGCYGVTFNSGLLSKLTTPCSIKFNGTSSTYVSSDATWVGGTSLSHYPDAPNCNSKNTYVMNPGITTGVIGKIFPDIDEVNTLCDLGYRLSGHYSRSTDAVYYHYYNTGCGGTTVSGTNDYAPYPATAVGSSFSVLNPAPITINYSDFMGNDKNANAYACMELIKGGSINVASSSTPSAASFTFTPDPLFVGVAIIKYIPVNTGTGKKGNTTYIFIKVNGQALPTCPTTNCNLVCNGDFEFVDINTIQLPLGDFYIGGTTGTPIQNTPNIWSSTKPINITCGTQPTIQAHTGQRFGGFVASAAKYEALTFRLNNNLSSGVTYNIGFWCRQVDATCGTSFINVMLNANAPCPQSTNVVTSTSTATSCGTYTVTPYFVGSTGTISANTWTYYSFTYQPSVNSINYLTIYPSGAGGGYSNALIDDISISQSNVLSVTATSSGPANVCKGEDFTYIFTVKKSLPTDVIPAAGIVLDDILPAGFTAKSIGSVGVLNNSNPANPKVTLYNSDFSPVGLATVQLTVNVGTSANTGNATNNLTVTSTGLCISGANTSIFTNNVVVQSLSILTTVSNPAPAPGSTVTYTVTVSNYTSTAYNNVRIQDVLPVGLTFVSSPNFTLDPGQISPPYSYTSNQFSIGAGTITNPAVVTLTLTASVDCNTSGTAISNCTRIISGGTTCANLPSCVTINVIQVLSPIAPVCSGSAPVTLTSNLPGGTFSGPNVAGNVFTPPTVGTTTTYTVSYTSTYNCVTTQTITVLSGTVCGCATTTLSGTITNTTYTGQALKIAANTTVTINGTVTFNNCNISIGKDAIINVPLSATNQLFITNNSHLFGCPEMWTGIIVSGEANLIVDNSLIEDAKIAIESVGGGSFTTQNGARLNKNRIGIQLDAITWTHPGIVKNTTISCYNPSGQPANVLIAPYAGGQGVTGINIVNVNQANIGLDQANQTNTIDYMQNCIVASNSGLRVYNTNFKNLGPYASSCGIKSTNTSGVEKNITVGGTGNVWQKNSFTNASQGVGIGVSVSNNRFVNINGNTFTNLTTGAQVVNGFTNGTINLEYNTITNCSPGIYCYANENGNVSNINHNTITNNNTPNNTAIKFQNTLVGNCSLIVGYNVISKAAIGIYLTNLIAPQIGYNNITALSDGYTSYTQNGIRIESSTNGLVYNNTIKGTADWSWAWYQTGIALESTTEFLVLYNNTENLGSNLYFGGVCTGTESAKNSMKNSFTGIAFNWCSIGDQLSLLRATENTWTGTFTHSHVDCYYTFGDQIKMYLFGVPSATNLMSPLPFLKTDAPGGSFSTPINNLPSNNVSGYKISNPKRDLYLRIAKNEIKYPLTYSESFKWTDKYNLYKNLSQNDSLLKNEDAELKAFSDSAALTNTGKLYEITKAFVRSNNNLNAFASELNSISASNVVEQNLKDVYSIYVSNRINNELSKKDIENLQRIAKQCPYEGGNGVYSARVMLSSVENTVYANNCDPKSKSAFKLAPTQLDKDRLASTDIYPNPANDKLNVAVHLEPGQKGVLSLYDLSGKMVQTNSLNIGDITEIPTSELSDGLYIYKLTIDNSFINSGKLSIIH